MFTQHYDTKALDASVLLILLFGFLPPTDERVRNTVLAIADELAEDEMVLRYRLDETDDGFSGEEGTFTICSFWLVSAPVDRRIGASQNPVRKAAVLGKQPPALRRGDRPDSGRHLGNFPQAFTHLALINAVTAVIEAERALVSNRGLP